MSNCTPQTKFLATPLLYTKVYFFPQMQNSIENQINKCYLVLNNIGTNYKFEVTNSFRFLSFFYLTVPSGRPVFIREKISTSLHGLHLVWRPPPLGSINGEFLGYQLAYRPSNFRSANRTLVYINAKHLNVQVKKTVKQERLMLSRGQSYKTVM
jgi:hypothetical protein